MAAKYTWERRIERAEELAQSRPYARTVMAFYTEVLKWQRDLSKLITAASVNQGLTGYFEHDHSLFVNSFDSLLEIVRRQGSIALAAQAEKLDMARNGWKALLADYWNGELDPEQSFFARICIQPYLERLADTQMPPADSKLMESLTTEIEALNIARPHRNCPFCGRKPQLTALSNETDIPDLSGPDLSGPDLSGGSVDGGRRFLICGDCLTAWPFQRVACVNCLEENPFKLSYYRAEAMPDIRVECCDTCRRYIKTIDLTRNNRCVPTVDELAAIPLDLWAREQKYHKIQPNLAGM
ncbi:MAG: formate dehydrogenase accessory protein FdhE [Acidobacteria bacterium]|nr:formate dehydrogenase accessory protein FdhE [Acidobacteriota bacterium]